MKTSKQTAELHKQAISKQAGCVCVCVCTRAHCISEGVKTQKRVGSSSQDLCVHRLTTMFTVSNELMSLMDGLSEAASFHRVSQPVWVFRDRV